MPAIFAQTTITFHVGETWRIDFSCHDADGSIMPLPSGSSAQFRLADNSGASPVDIFTRDTTNDVAITDAVNGLGTVTISPATQLAYGITAGGAYLWELRIETPLFVSIQGSGKFRILTSLFALTGP